MFPSHDQQKVRNKLVHKLSELIYQRTSDGLRRKSIVTCSKWAQEYRVMGGTYPGPWNHEHFPWLKEIMDDESEESVIMKCAQSGFTEAMLNLCLYSMDMKALSCLYILPNKTPDATDFAAARFGAALDLSPHISNIFSDVNNNNLKRAGSACLYTSGS